MADLAGPLDTAARCGVRVFLFVGALAYLPVFKSLQTTNSGSALIYSKLRRTNTGVLHNCGTCPSERARNSRRKLLAKHPAGEIPPPTAG